MAWSGPSTSRSSAAVLSAAIVAAAVWGIGLAAAVPVRAVASLAIPPANTTATYILHGSATKGWGNTTADLTNPGPTLYVYAGQNVSLILYSDDGIPHTWFIDFNNNQRTDGSEPTTAIFSSPSAPLVYNFTVPWNWTGEWTYRCGIHPLQMTGMFVVLTPNPVALYGSLATPTGWGYNNTSISTPGPTLVFLQGTNLTLHLFSKDGVDHTWFIDYNGDGGANSDEPQSAHFNASSPATYRVTLNRAGTWTYRCGIHTQQMYGTITVASTGAAPPPGFTIGLVPGIMLVTVVAVLVLAGVYQVRAVRAARKQAK